ncbi:MAG TPA: helix-turn-helix domain-containing protein [Ktedonobacterales bacterium]|nr:helix-turn-helix domain-containing protein [Ktedonobacterales bacterium]
MTDVSERLATEERFLDAAERLLIRVGYANISTRRLAEEAGANHGLVHYYFGSMEQLLIRVLERFTERLIARQRAMYAADAPFIEKWRQAMSFLDEDLDSGYEKIWFELQALAWNRPELQGRLIRVRRQWTEVLIEAFQRGCDEYELDTNRFPVEALAALAGTFNEGIILNRLSGVHEGHAALLEMVDRWLVSLEEAKASRRRDHESPVP